MSEVYDYVLQVFYINVEGLSSEDAIKHCDELKKSCTKRTNCNFLYLFLPIIGKDRSEIIPLKVPEIGEGEMSTLIVHYILDTTGFSVDDVLKYISRLKDLIKQFFLPLEKMVTDTEIWFIPSFDQEKFTVQIIKTKNV